MYIIKSIILIVATCVSTCDASEQCLDRCNVDVVKRGFIAYDSNPPFVSAIQAPFANYKRWTLQSNTPTTFLLHLTQIQEEAPEPQRSSGGLSISYYQKSTRWADAYSWTPPRKLLSQPNEILYLQNTKSVWIFWSPSRGQQIKFNINYNVGCGWAYGDDIKIEKEVASDDTCWIIVPRTDDYETVEVRSRYGTYQRKRFLESENTFVTLSNIDVVGSSTVEVSNLVTDSEEPFVVGKLQYSGTEENIPIGFQKSEGVGMSINKVKFRTAVFLQIKCDKNKEDCRNTKFTFSSRALSSEDQGCIDNEMMCRLNGTDDESCLNQYTDKSQVSARFAADEETPVENMVWTQCDSYGGIVTDLIGDSDDGFEEFGDTARLARRTRRMVEQCNSRNQVLRFCNAVRTHSRGKFQCGNLRNRRSIYYNPTCHKWCYFLQLFYCKHLNRYRLF